MYAEYLQIYQELHRNNKIVTKFQKNTHTHKKKNMNEFSLTSNARHT